MRLADEVEKINKQAEELHKDKSIENIMNSFSKEVDEFLKG